MFKCTECEKLFEIRPQYCDCGNDIFEEIVQTNNRKKTSGGFAYIKERLERKNISLFALMFFFCSIIFSIIILFTNIGNEKQNISSKNQVKEKLQKNINIPEIDKLWNDTLPQNIQTTNKTNTTKNIQNKNIQTKTNPVLITKQTPKTTKNTSTSKINKEIQTPKTEKKPVAQATKKTNKTEQTKQTIQKTQSNNKPKVNTEELNKYKIALRSALFSKLSITEIQGNGSCGVEFSIDSSGKLINRAFTYQSDNKTINDEVYKMMMRLPSFYPPPNSYNGAKIKINFTFNNGSYSIDFTN